MGGSVALSEPEFLHAWNEDTASEISDPQGGALNGLVTSPHLTLQESALISLLFSLLLPPWGLRCHSVGLKW